MFKFYSFLLLFYCSYAVTMSNAKESIRQSTQQKAQEIVADEAAARAYRATLYDALMQALQAQFDNKVDDVLRDAGIKQEEGIVSPRANSAVAAASATVTTPTSLLEQQEEYKARSYDLLIAYLKKEFGSNYPQIFLKEAILADSALLVKVWLQAGADIRAFPFSGYTFVQLAVVERKYKALKQLLESNYVPINIYNQYIQPTLKHLNCADNELSPLLTPLMLAIKLNDCTAVELLLHAGALVNNESGCGLRAIHLAVRSMDICRLLVVREGIELNAADWRGKTALMHAAYYGNRDVVKLLIEMNASIECTCFDKKRALHYAAANGNSEIVDVLIHERLQKAVYLAALNHYDDILQCIKAQKFAQALKIAASSRCNELTDCLVSHLARVNAIDVCKKNALYYAAQNGHASIVQSLLSAGAIMPNVNQDGKTALSAVVEKRKRLQAQIEFFKYQAPCEYRDSEIKRLQQLRRRLKKVIKVFRKNGLF